MTIKCNACGILMKCKTWDTHRKLKTHLQMVAFLQRLGCDVEGYQVFSKPVDEVIPDTSEEDDSDT